MSSRREVLIRILALLQGKTLIETKNRRSMWRSIWWDQWKKVAVLTEDGAFALFFRPHPVGFGSSRAPTAGNLPSEAKMLMLGDQPGGQPGGGEAGLRWNWLMHYCDRQECLGERRNKKDRIARLFSSRWFDQILARSWSYWCIEKGKHRYINGPDLRGKLFVFSVVARVIPLPRNY